MRFVVYQSINKTTTRNDVIKLTTRKTSNATTNANANVETTNDVETTTIATTNNERVIVHTNDTNVYKTMRSNVDTKRNVRFDHSKCAHRNDKNDRNKCRRSMIENATTFVYVENTNAK